MCEYKGGVAKTTVALSLAECSAYLETDTCHRPRPADHASTTLVGDNGEPWKTGNTVEDYFRARQLGQPTAAKALITPIDDKLDLLSGKLSIVLFERELLARGNAPFAANTAVAAWLGELLVELKPHYSLIVFDTPPGLSILAECAIRAVDLVVVPQVPDKLSSRGIDVYAKYLKDHLGLATIGEKSTVLINMVPTTEYESRTSLYR